MTTDSNQDQPHTGGGLIQAGEPAAAPSPAAAELPAIEVSVQDVAPAQMDSNEDGQGGGSDDNAPLIEPLPKRDNVKQELEIFLPVTEEQMQGLPTVALPSTTWERQRQMLNATPNVDLEMSPGAEQWAAVLEQSAMVTPAAKGFEGTVTREDSQFRQMVPSEKGPLAAAQPRLKEDTAGAMWTGEQAVLRVKSILGMGSMVQVPLWHSGFWVTLKAPTEGALLELNRRLTEEKVTLGRQTYGMAFANSSVFFAGWIMNFVLEHVLSTTLKPGLTDVKTLRQRIKSPDLQILAWGMACTIWPRGFPYARAVIDPKGEQTKVIREMVAVGKLQWTDIASLTEWQRGHMAQRHGQTMSEEALEKYQVEFTRGKGRALALSDRVSLNLKVPSLEEYVNSGYKWVNGIISMVDSAFQMDPGSEERNRYILDQGKASFMRQYGHWVESVVVDGTNVIDHPETVESTLDALSANDEMRQKFFDGVRDFIDDSTVSLIAITASEEGDVAPLPRFPNLLPIDALSVFFILLVQKVARIQTR